MKNDKKPFIVIETNNETTLENIVSEMALEAYLKMIEVLDECNLINKKD